MGISPLPAFSYGRSKISVLVTHFNYGLADTVGIVKIKETNSLNLPVFSSRWLIQELWWFLVGNIGYYGLGILLACRTHDNRAFCKYFCPIVGFLKVGSRFSIIKIGTQKEKCTDCKICEQFCPMDIKLTEYIKSDRRITSSECVICKTCTTMCPHDVLSVSFGFDISKREYLRYREVCLKP